jgi:hypothetical protein
LADEFAAELVAKRGEGSAQKIGKIADAFLRAKAASLGWRPLRTARGERLVGQVLEKVDRLFRQLGLGRHGSVNLAGQ